MAEKESKAKKSSIIKKLIKFFKEVRSELKKVVWLSRRQLLNNIAAVIVICLFFGIFIWALDFGLSWIVDIALR